MKLNYIDYKNYRIPIYIEDNKVDTTFLFCHGLNSSSNFIQKMLKYKHDYNVVAINFPGSRFFKSVKPEEITLEWWIEAAEQVINQIKTKNIIVVGHSMGGGVALKLAKNPKVKRIIMMSTINPNMVNTNSYSILQKVISPKGKMSSIVGKFITNFTSKFNKTRRLNESFSRSGAWFNLLEKYILNEEYMKELDKDYKKYADKIIFIIGDKDNIIGTKYFLEYAEELNVPYFVVGRGHSPAKSDPKRLAVYFNRWEMPKKRHWWQGFVKFKNKIYEATDNKKDSDEDIELIEAVELVETLNQGGENNGL
ncbi:alpha/beta hydrolase [Mycoplasmopsis lipofaciens]|uniref:alpha/beta hydrolase n=1 Tax=Mycoplasmopsis lipofaciens TaxID=114884 RepID=UPI00048193A1|nr:alpha/beta fold hydrolase [Mycoplasmopsis lipofaciens]